MNKNGRFALILAAGLLTCSLSGAAAQTPTVTPESALQAIFAQHSVVLASSGSGGVTPACGPFCDTSIHASTTTISGSGPDCTTAQSSLMSQLQSIANADCKNNWTGLGQCNFIVHDTTSCTQIAPGTFQVQGYATYSCRDTTC